MYNFGVIPSPPDDRDYPVTAIVPPVKVPKSVRLDNKILAVLNQGRFGTCVGKGSNAILSAGHKKLLSSLYIYTRCKEQDGIPDIEGTYPRIALKVMQKEGSCNDGLLPYAVLKSHDQLPRITQAMTTDAGNHTIDMYARLRTSTDIKQALASGHMVGVTYRVGQNWMNYRGGVIEKATDQIGLHWVVLCGYDDRGFRGLNSWGARWGDGGFFWVDAMDDVVEAWAIKMVDRKSCLREAFEKIERILQKVRL